MTKSTGCSIWLMPTGRICEQLRMTILQLSSQYATPRFPPHVTLIGRLTGDERELASRAEQLASRIRPFEITLTGIDHLDEYFRCLFMRVEESRALLEANQAARVIFNLERDPEFIPHLSLIYGSLDLDAKRQTIRLIGAEANSTFQVDSLHLYSTAGEPEGWYRIQEFEMHS